MTSAQQRSARWTNHMPPSQLSQLIMHSIWKLDNRRYLHNASCLASTKPALASSASRLARCGSVCMP